MPSPTAGLFGGLAQGIFGRMREHEDEQRKMDLEDKKNALNGLSSLLEHATPETRPIIYKQMANVMSLKGRHRGVWDMLTGQGRDDYHNQLSQSLDNVFGNVMGPKAYEAATQAAPTSGNADDWQDESAPLSYTPPAGKIALRDPIAEHLAGLQSQYGLRNQQDMAKIAFQQDQMEERQRALQADRFKLNAERDDHRAQIAAEKEVKALATAYALKRQSNVPSEEDLAQAAEQVASKYNLKLDDLKAAIGLKGAETKRAEAQADYYGSGGPGGVGRPMTENQQRTFDAGQRAQAAGTFEKWNKAKASINRLDTEHRAARQQINQLAQQNGVSYDEANGRFYDKNGQTVDPDLLGIPRRQLDGLLNKMAKLSADKAAALSEMQGHRATLEGQFPSLYTFGDQWSVTPNPEVGGLAPAGAPRTGNPPEWKVPTGPVTGVTQYKSTAPLPKGTVIETGRGKFRIIGVAGKDKDGTVVHNIEPVKE